MKEITEDQYELIIDAIASKTVRYLSPAGLEKDLLLTDLLNHLSKFRDLNFKITFGGGTSLTKNHEIINRLSEDLDFKISSNEYLRLASPRSHLRTLHKAIQNHLNEGGFTFDVGDPADSYNAFSFLIHYQSRFAPETSLRSDIRLEFTSSLVNPKPEFLRIRTVLLKELGLSETQSEIACVTVVQTLAEKIVGILSKVESIRDETDDQLVRHISDIHEISLLGIDSKILSECFNNAVQEDLERFGSRNLDLRDQGIRSDELTKLWNISNIEVKYQDYVILFSNTRESNFDQAKDSLNRICKSLK